MRAPLRSLVVVMALKLLAPASAHAAVTYQVNNAGDAGDANPGDNVCQTATPGVCTLRAAIEEANMTGGVIGFPAMTVSLGTTLVVTNTMRIEGSGAAVSVISANLLVRVLRVQPAQSAIALTIRDVTLRDGTVGDGDQGGAFEVASGGSVTLERCRIVHNFAGFGGAMLANNGSTITIKDSEITDNHASSFAGGLYCFACVMNVSGSSIHDNDTTGSGGAVVSQFGAAVTLTNSTIARNTAGESGGGIYVVNSLVQPNVTLYNSTLTANRARNGGGAGIKADAGTLATVQNSILAFNYSGAMILAESDVNGPLTSSGTNIVRHQTNGTLTGTVSAADPLLGPFQDNGGRGPTSALKSGSPAIDAGPVSGCTGPGNTALTTDQRGVNRTLGARCDLGAYERGPCGDVNGDGSVSVGDVFFLINALFAGGAPPPGLANVNGDSQVNVSDVFFLINQLFAGGSAPTCAGT